MIDRFTFSGSLLTRGLFLALGATALTAASASAQAVDRERLEAVLSAQPEAVQGLYAALHPAETLAFFGIEPGMTVVEALPGGGWYSKILIDYLGPDGALIGADYAVDMFPLFGFFSDEALEAKKTWVQDWSEEANGWVEGGAPVSAFQLGSLPESMEGTADAVVMIRALHNLARFEGRGGFLTAAVQDVYDILKPGGMLGVVQHEARPDMPDDFATGAGGYLKKSFIIEQMEAAGFDFVADSDINQNPKDQPQEGDVVWRLPPTLATTRDDPDGRAAMEAIGESNRMTLKFRKPL